MGMFRDAPAVAIPAALTLTLGIGATTAIFSMANALTLRPLPVRSPRDLVTVTSETALRYGFRGGAGVSHAIWDRLRQRAGAFDGAFAWTSQRLDLSDGGEMEPATVLVASGGFFDMLGVPAAIGRTFTAADDVPGGGPDGAVAVISHDLWQRRFGGTPDVLGSRMRIEQVPVTIVGVAPRFFTGVTVGQPFDAAIPFGTESIVRGPRASMNNERTLILSVMLRLKPGQGVPAATAALRAMQPDLLGPGAPAFLEEPFVLADASTGISDRLRQQYQSPLLILSIVSAIVLVIVCLNLANLLLSRASARRPELSVRLALGATRWRVARLYLTEALALGAAGAAGGLVFAVWASRALVTQLPSDALSIELPIDWRVCAFTACAALGAAAILGTVPALYATRVPPIEALRHAGRAQAGGRTGVLSSGLVVAQVALSIVLLAGAGLFVRTMNRLVSVPLGFDPKGLVVVTVNTSRSTAETVNPAGLRHALLDAVAAAPGVLQASGSAWAPVGTGGGGLLTDARGRRATLSQEASRQVAFNFVMPGWFRTYGTPITLGRDFDAGDGPGAQPVALVNESFRRRLLNDGEPLGATIHAGPCPRDGCRVVGVVADVVYGQSLRDAAPPTVYVPLAQSASLAGSPFRLSIRAAGDPASVMSGLTARLRGVDSRVTFSIRRLELDLAASVAQERLLAMLSAFFGAIALLLSGIGLYGVSAYAATRRRAEIGIRLALGGQPPAIVRAIVGRIALLVLGGAVAGLAAALWLGRFVTPLLFGLAPYDPVTLAASALTLAIVGTIAAWIPAWRATRVDPAEVLRTHVAT